MKLEGISPTEITALLLILNQLMVEDPLQLVRFDFNPVRLTSDILKQRKINRLQNRYVKYPPLNMCAHWILQSYIFKNLILYLIIINTIVFALEAGKIHLPLTILQVIDWSIFSFLLSEVILRWLDDFPKFWTNRWNIFDLFVLLLVRIARKYIFKQKYNLCSPAGFKHKLNSKLGKKNRNYIFLSLWEYNVVKKIFFLYSGIMNALQTLFQLFTLDHWYALLNDVWRVKEVDAFSTGVYIIVWILIGSFIFRNIMVGIMVSNFQSIRAELSVQIQQMEILKKADYFKQHHQILKIFWFAFYTEWESQAYKNIQLLKSHRGSEKVTWPRDSLFRYYELLEQLQYNLEERNKLQDLAAQCLLNMHDV
uniref:Ion transport domain-containing protein n=1 Tax=Callorhinchus milii TaxID=7868 RepID=A0A4W3H4B8_CALMI